MIEVDVSPLILTNVLYSHRYSGQLDYAAYEVLGEMFEDWPDERKADLYASLVESVQAHDTWVIMYAKVGKALESNAKRFYA